jgi:serine/threonine-protein kinase HipA
MSFRIAEVKAQDQTAGYLWEIHGEQGTGLDFVFAYHPDFLANPALPALSLTLPKRKSPYRASFLFPFFHQMIAEGANRNWQLRYHQIDERDGFGLLMATATHDTIGWATVHPCASLPPELLAGLSPALQPPNTPAA